MKRPGKSSIKHWLICAAAASMLIIVGLVSATDICHEHTSNGSQADYFTPAYDEDILLDAKALSSGDLWAYVDRGGQDIIAQVFVSDGARNSTKIPYESMSALNQFVSRVTNHGSGTGYANVVTLKQASTCIPSGTPD